LGNQPVKELGKANAAKHQAHCGNELAKQNRISPLESANFAAIISSHEG
jgi:hypothetical protein